MLVLSQLRVTLTLVARFLCGQLGVSVRFTNDSTASTDGRDINLPAIPRLEPFSNPWRQLRARLLGYLVHEAGHIRFTTFRAREGLVSLPMAGFLLDLSNVLEDIRIERQLMQFFRFAREYLHGLNIALVKETALEDLSGAAPTQLVIDYVHHRLRAAVLRMPECQPPCEHHEAELSKRFKRSMLVKLSALADSVANCRDTAAVVELTKDIAAMLQQEAEEPEEEDQDPASGAGQPSPPQANQAGGASAPSPQGGDAANSGGQPTPGEALLAALQQHTAGSCQGNGEDAAQALGDAAHQARATGGEVPPLAAPDSRTTPRHSAQGSQFLSAARASSARIRQAMVSLLSNEYREAKTYHEEGRRLAYNRLALVPVGERSIFIRQGRGVQSGATVALEIDASASMAGEKFELARRAILALTAALDLVREVRFMANAFGYRGRQSTLIKALDEPIWIAAERLAEMNGAGGTPMGEAIAFTSVQMLASTDRAKLLIVITDGEPDSQDAVLQAVADARAIGVVVAGIGIKSNAGAGLFDHWIQIDNISELPDKLVRLVMTQLRSSLARAA